jgi:CDP-4-dehydro-6-deoxyglucose reductase
MMKIKTIKGSELSSTEEMSILDSALLRGFIFEYSCKSGQCGVCKATLIDGQVSELQPQLALTDEEKKNHKILTCCCEPITDILIDAEDLTALKSVEVKTLPARISHIKALSNDIIKVQFRFPPAANFKFIEGQYLDVIWGSVRRSYSIASMRDDQEVTLLIKKVALGVMSDYVFNHAKVNDLIRVEGPKGTFFLRNISRPLILLATGTGIAPIMSILSRLDKDEELSPQHTIHLFWGNRYVEDFVWQPEFSHIKVIIEHVVSKPDDHWQGQTGYIQKVALRVLGSKIIDSDVYACGANAMIQSAKQLFIEQGLPEKQFYSDAFVQSF